MQKMVKNMAKTPGKNSRGAELDRGLARFKPLSAEYRAFFEKILGFQPGFCVFITFFQKTPFLIKKSEKNRP